MDALEGSVFAGYRIERRLGSGGMAFVYRAQHPRLPRKEALKILGPNQSEDPEFNARFLREAEMAAQLDHPNLVAVHDRGIHDGRLWIAMQYVDGIDAAQLIREGASVLPPERTLFIIGQAARGLDEIHGAGLVHRDVKPANIMVTRGRDGSDRVLVTDFGIARSADDTGRLTGSGSMVGTLAYVAPEQLQDQPVDHRTDVYALGCTLYQMLTGALPFPRKDPGSVVWAHLYEQPPRPSQAGRGLPIELDAVIARAMAKDPAWRYPSCGALAADALAAFHRSAAEPPTVRQSMPPIAQPPDSSMPRHPLSSMPHQSQPSMPHQSQPSSPGVSQWSNPRPPEPSMPRLSQPSMLAPLQSLGTRPPRRLGLRLGIGIGAVVLILLVTVGVVALRGKNGPDTPPVASGPATATTSVSADSYPAWKSYGFIVAAFPALLPDRPSTVNIGGSGSCYPTDENDNEVSADVAPKTTASIFCAGVAPPADAMTFMCLTDRTPMPATADSALTVEGRQDWTRSSGSGHLVWGKSELTPGRVRGVLQVFFDNPARYFCSLTVVGGTTGTDLLQRWWPSAPL
ncbi:protein kinase [Nocardia sp. NPDC051030]|uniref:serine/threonine-protein kinase n=1 Tax=Nocardia sp. NPDC051030 TaxID=3155162 RepID=UPI00341CEB97